MRAHKCQIDFGKVMEDCREDMAVMKVILWQVYDSGGHRASWFQTEALQVEDEEVTYGFQRGNGSDETFGRGLREEKE